MPDDRTQERLPYPVLLELKRWNTPSVYNGWERISKHDRARGCVNLEPTRDFMPQMGPMVGYAITVVVEPGNPAHARSNPGAWGAYRRYVASVPGPKIVVVQDLDKPRFTGAFWGEVNSNTHRALGCVGTIIDGAIRDVDEMCNAGFKALASGMAVGHAYSTPIRWDGEVEVFGCTVRPGQLIHADKHGFLVIPAEDESRVLDACRFMDATECQTLIAAARLTAGKGTEEMLRAMEEAERAFDSAVRGRFGS